LVNFFVIFLVDIDNFSSRLLLCVITLIFLLQTTVEAIQEDVLAALENKDPQVKAETASFLARCFTKCTPVMLNKKLLKAYTTSLLKTLNQPGI
jgi:hypothetical protein